MLTEVLSRDGEQLSATQTWQQALADADHLAGLHAIWTAKPPRPGNAATGNCSRPPCRPDTNSRPATRPNGCGGHCGQLNSRAWTLAGLGLVPGEPLARLEWQHRAASIGYSVGALLGTLTAAPDRRRLLFIGDGSFQETAQELSTTLRHDCKPVVFLINNGGYTIERGYMGKTADYNDIARWAYADLPKVCCLDTTARSFVCRTGADLEAALCGLNDSLILIESVMDPHDAPAAVIHSSNNGAELDFGLRGPQHRGNAQLLPAT